MCKCDYRCIYEFVHVLMLVCVHMHVNTSATMYICYTRWLVFTHRPRLHKLSTSTRVHKFKGNTNYYWFASFGVTELDMHGIRI